MTDPVNDPLGDQAGTRPDGPDEAALRLAEAVVFSSAAPVTARALSQVLPVDMDPEAVIEALRARYAGRGVELVEAGGGVQFRTAPDLAPSLRKVVEVPRRLTRVAMETLAIVAYHQPVTRADIEHLRGTSLSQQTLESLLDAQLIAPAGRKESPGRPTLWVTTPQFLAVFGLADLRSLPRREDLLLEPPRPADPPKEAAADTAGAVDADEGASADAPQAIGPGAAGAGESGGAEVAAQDGPAPASTAQDVRAATGPDAETGDPGSAPDPAAPKDAAAQADSDAPPNADGSAAGSAAAPGRDDRADPVSRGPASC